MTEKGKRAGHVKASVKEKKHRKNKKVVKREAPAATATRSAPTERDLQRPQSDFWHAIESYPSVPV